MLSHRIIRRVATAPRRPQQQQMRRRILTSPTAASITTLATSTSTPSRALVRVSSTPRTSSLPSILTRSYHSSSSSSSSSSSHSSSSFPRIGLVLTLSSGLIAYVIYRSPFVYAAEEVLPIPSAPTIEPAKKKTVRRKNAPLRNPGPLSKYHEDAKNVYQIHAYTGARVTLGRTMAFSGGEMLQNPNIPSDKQLNVSYSLEMGNPQIPGGAVAALQVMSRLNGATLQGTMNTMYHSNGAVSIPFWDKFISKTNWNINDQQNMYTLELDYNARSSSYNCTLQNFQVVTASGNMALTPGWSAGAELLAVPLAQRYGANLGVRYKTDYKQPNETYTATYQTFSEETTLSYIRQVNENTSLATELQFNWRTRESQAVVGMQHNHATYQFNAAVNSDATVMVSMEQRMGAMMSFQITGEMNHVQQESQVGVAFTVQV